MSISLSPVSAVHLCAVAKGGSEKERTSEHVPFSPAHMTSPHPAKPPTDDREAIDASLMGRIARGDKQAFTALYDRFSSPLYAMALHIIHDPAEAQDIVHDVFVTVWEKAGTFDLRRGSAFSWVVTLVRHRAIDRVRMRRRRAGLLADSAPSDLGYQENAPGASADVSMMISDDARTVRTAVAALPREQQRALELAFFAGLTQEQIAEKLQEPLGTVKARIRRGLLKLRDALVHRL